MRLKRDIILASLSGVLLVLGFPRFNIYPLAWTALVPLLIAIQGRPPRSSFNIGVLTGLIYFLGTVYWVYHSMFHYGGIPLAGSVLILILLCLVLALYIGLFSMLFSYISNNSPFPALLTAPVLWVSIEYLRTYAFTGFPWSILGYSQYKFLPLIQIADITGVYGISFLVAALNGAIYDVAFKWRMKSPVTPPGSRWPLVLGVGTLTLVTIGVLVYGTIKLKEDAPGEKIKVSVIQGNIPQDEKWDLRFKRKVIDTYKRLSITASSEKPDIIVWPESALPFVFGYEGPLTAEITAFQKQLNTYLIFGSVLVKESENGKNRLSNSALMLSPEGGLSVYDKIHLVPFGEYVPLGSIFPFVKKMVTAIGDFVHGRETTVMKTPRAEIGNLICYEIFFPGLARKFVNKGANVLVTITNDAWFGDTAGPYQNFAMTALRAVENRVPVVRAANTGISGFIDPKGRIISQSDIFVEKIMTEDITLGSARSFYTRHGDIFTYICIAVSLLLIAGRYFFNRTR